MALHRPGAIANGNVSSPRPAGTVLKVKIPADTFGSSRPAEKSEGTLNRIFYLFKKEKWQTQNGCSHYTDLLRKIPSNTRVHLELAESYEKKGEIQKAISEYLKTAEILSQKKLYPQAIALCKQILRQHPTFDIVTLKMADIYREMGSIAEAYSQYGRLLRHYNKEGKEDKALEVMCLMAELSMHKIQRDAKGPGFVQASKIAETGGRNGDSPEIPQSEKRDAFFDLNTELQVGEPIAIEGGKEIDTDKIYGFEEILQELKRTNISTAAYPQFNFHMGVACRQMGFIHEAIEQFRVALEKEQNCFEAAHLLGHCFQEKGCWDEARQSFAQALRVEGASPERIREIKNDLAGIDREEKREKDKADGLLPDTLARRELGLFYRTQKKVSHFESAGRPKMQK